MTLRRSRAKMACQCCADVEPRWCYRVHAFYYCARCLRSVLGVGTDGLPFGAPRGVS